MEQIEELERRVAELERRQEREYFDSDLNPISKEKFNEIVGLSDKNK